MAPTMLYPMLLFVLLFNSVIGRLKNPFRVDQTTRRSPVRISTGCSGTLISSNIVYTAAHCLMSEEATDIWISHWTQPSKKFWVKSVYYQERFREAWNFLKNEAVAYERKCNSSDCGEGCVKYMHDMNNFFNTLDFAIILLTEHVPVCEIFNGPVAAHLETPPISEDENIFVPVLERMECFVAGFGTTEYEEVKDINMGVISRIKGMEHGTGCGTPRLKEVHIQFKSSDMNKGYDTSLCPGDSGAGIQCISRSGRDISVIGIATQITVDLPNGSTNREVCLAPHLSIALAAADHSPQLLGQITAWGEMTNYENTRTKCQSFLRTYPYHSLMWFYFSGDPEF